MSNTFVGGWEVCLAKHTNSLQCYEALRELRDPGSFAGTFASYSGSFVAGVDSQGHSRAGTFVSSVSNCRDLHG